MRVLAVHNRYQYAGGEDAVFAAETALLERAGHDVSKLTFDNDDIDGAMASARVALSAPYNSRSTALVDERIGSFRPDVMHVHNWFPKASPAIFVTARKAGVATVWTLHNFRVTCLNGLLFRDGRICEDCLGKPQWPGIVHRCYRGSLPGSATIAAVNGVHAILGTYAHKIDRMIALNDFARAKFVEAGLPEQRLTVKPNFIEDPGPPKRRGEPDHAVFIGRLSSEKGVGTLIDAWRDMPMPLTIIGTGPLESELEAAAGPQVRFTGHLDADAIQAHLHRAAMIVIPSLWYENFPMVLVEALAHGVPALVSSGGALASLVADGVEGWHFAMGDASDLARKAREALGDPKLLEDAARAARARYERELTPQANLQMLERIYRDAMASSAR